MFTREELLFFYYWFLESLEFGREKVRECYLLFQISNLPQYCPGVFDGLYQLVAVLWEGGEGMSPTKQHMVTHTL